MTGGKTDGQSARDQLNVKEKLARETRLSKLPSPSSYVMLLWSFGPDGYGVQLCHSDDYIH